MLDFIKQHKIFYSLWLLFVVMGSLYFFFFSKGDFNLYFNCNKNVCFNYYFKTTTHISEFYISMLVALLLFSYRIAWGIFYLINAFIISLIVNLLKTEVFNAPRPVIYFQPYFNLDPVPGVGLLERYSFPSGHSTFAFGSMLVFAIAIKNKWVSLICFLLALSTAFSRIYLLQHFYEDIYAGAILGVLITTINYALTEKWMINSDRNWLKFSLFHRMFKHEKV